MRIGLLDGGQRERRPATLDEHIERARLAEDVGLASVWFSNIYGHDAMTVAALAARATTRIEIGTAITPTYPRHPHAMAQQAASTGAAARGRFTLGVGPSHRVVVEDMWGLSYERAYPQHGEDRARRNAVHRPRSPHLDRRTAGAGTARRPRSEDARARRHARGRHHNLDGGRAHAPRSHRAPRARSGGAGRPARPAHRRRTPARADRRRGPRARAGWPHVQDLRIAAGLSRDARPGGCRRPGGGRHRRRPRRDRRTAAAAGRGGRDRLQRRAIFAR